MTTDAASLELQELRLVGGDAAAMRTSSEKEAVLRAAGK